MLALLYKDTAKDQMLTLYRRKRIPQHDLEHQLNTMVAEVADLKARLSTLETMLEGQETIATQLLESRHLLETLRAELKEEFTWEEKRAIVVATRSGGSHLPLSQQRPDRG